MAGSKWDEKNKMNDSDVLKRMTECQKTSGLSEETFWEMHPLARHMRDKTTPALYKGCSAPDAEVYTFEGEKVELHSIIKDAGGGVALPYTVLNFGSYT